jgi:sulfane dehydrogenase subunit SoxC
MAKNGETVRPEQGYPLRLVVPGWEGVNNVKWLRRIKLVDQPYMTHLETTQYPSIRPILEGKALWFNFEMEPKSVITFPSGGHRVPARGFYEITGLAWSGRSAIHSVEVSADGGKMRQQSGPRPTRYGAFSKDLRKDPLESLRSFGS